MFRILASIVLYALVGRWILAETQLLAPSLVPVIESSLDGLALPTHDRWDPKYLELVATAMDELKTNLRQANEAQALDFTHDLPLHRNAE